MIGIREAVRKADGGPQLARKLGVSHQAVYQWLAKGWVPLSRALQIERLYGIPRQRLVSPRIGRLLKPAKSKGLDLI